MGILMMRMSAKAMLACGAAAACVIAASSASRAQTAAPQAAEPQTATAAPASGLWLLGQPYVRADAGGAFSLDQHYHNSNPSAPNALLGPGGSIDGGVAPTGAFDVGFGTRILPAFRWDATLSYIPSMNFSGTANAAPGGSANANVDSLVGMVNGYFDFAGFGYYLGPFQPYIDASVGAASNHLHDMNTTSVGLIAGGTRTSLAWGVGTGLALPVGQRTTLDISYKYLDLGDAETGATDAAGSIAPLKADVRTNLVLAGLRFGF
jgi:opacity protein-like surface antigen